MFVPQIYQLGPNIGLGISQLPIIFCHLLKKGSITQCLFWVGTSPSTTLTFLNLDQITWDVWSTFETGGTSAVTGPVPPPAADVVPRSSGFFFVGARTSKLGLFFFSSKKFK